jgi:hypothetical protein
LIVADMGNHESVINLFFARRPEVMFRLCSNGVLACKRDGVLRQVLDRWEASSAMTLLLCVKRTRALVVAGRILDVLRKLLSEFTKFQMAFIFENSDCDDDMMSSDGDDG